MFVSLRGAFGAKGAADGIAGDRADGAVDGLAVKSIRLGSRPLLAVREPCATFRTRYGLL
ncbi:hypothetical protein CG723_33815 [Streptomyces sp. CB01635]|uniref:hypothetical protein n=1 Tax=unclassified Streptomyces TaxID=2593676 RepID=UPI000C276013|nr:hypothetical protein [Streptomyces sp. CB01635]PJN07473.1 hypothetical protein CG723_33815 [Streptomyces sp. CB01635]